MILNIFVPFFIYFVSVFSVEFQSESSVRLLRDFRTSSTTLRDTIIDFSKKLGGFVAASESVIISTFVEVSDNSETRPKKKEIKADWDHTKEVTNDIKGQVDNSFTSGMIIGCFLGWFWGYFIFGDTYKAEQLLYGMQYIPEPRISAACKESSCFQINCQFFSLFLRTKISRCRNIRNSV